MKGTEKKVRSSEEFVKKEDPSRKVNLEKYEQFWVLKSKHVQFF